MNCFLITTYNRTEAVKKLYTTVKDWGDVFILNDGGTIPDVPVIHQEHRGKEGYYKTVSNHWDYAKRAGIYDFYFMLPDDMLPVENFVSEAVRIWGMLPKDKICLNLFCDKLRYKKMCWTYQPQIKYSEFINSGWVDGAFIATRKFFELQNFSVNKPDRDFESGLGSGFGSVVSKFLHGQGYGLYQVKKSLLIPQKEAYESKMNPDREDDINSYL